MVILIFLNKREFLNYLNFILIINYFLSIFFLIGMNLILNFMEEVINLVISNLVK